MRGKLHRPDLAVEEQLVGGAHRSSAGVALARQPEREVEFEGGIRRRSGGGGLRVNRSAGNETSGRKHEVHGTSGSTVVKSTVRLQNVTPVSYTEVPVGKSLKSEDDLLREAGSKPETYSEEHEKLLGSTKMNWTLFVDGYGKDGKRIYDPIKGKTCHQCRQKTLGHRTHCSKCNMVQGQFCGDCLYMRYGEHVLEANCNPDWICPVCRGICNCSLCRQAKGWAPTGPLYKKIKNLGYESVAHYLIQTHRANTNPENNVPNSAPDSAKRSDVEATSSEKESSEACNDSKELPNSQTAEKIMEYEATEADDDKITSEASTYPSTESLSQETIPIPGNYPNSIEVSSLEVILNVEHASSYTNDGEPSPGDLAPETSSKSIRKRRAAEGIPADNIAKRRRQRHYQNN
nr:cell division cycle-associated protein 7-like [Ipomoea batatas]